MTLPTEQQDKRTDISADPDNVTLDLAVYGSNYSRVTTAFYQIDSMVHQMQLENADILADVNLELFQNIINEAPEFLRMDDRNIPPDYVKVVQQARVYVRNIDAIEVLKLWRIEIDLWGRMRGAAQRGKQMQAQGISERTWEIASHQLNKKPISYETVREAEIC